MSYTGPITTKHQSEIQYNGRRTHLVGTKATVGVLELVCPICGNWAKTTNGNQATVWAEEHEELWQRSEDAFGTFSDARLKWEDGR